MDMDNPSGTQTGSIPSGAISPDATPPAPPSPPAFDGPDWMSKFPDDLKDSKSLRKFKDVENLARGYINAEQLLGRDKIPIPKTDSEWAEVYARLGCPTDEKEYDIKAITPVPESLEPAVASDIKAFKTMAKEAGLNNKQANLLFNRYAGQLAERVKEAEQRQIAEYTKAERELKAELGETYGPKLELVNRMLTNLGGEEVVKAIADSGLGRNPAFIKMMIKLGDTSAEQLGIDKTGQSSLLTPANIKQQIAELQAHPAYMDASHPEHRSVVDRVQQLFMRATQS